MILGLAIAFGLGAVLALNFGPLGSFSDRLRARYGGRGRALAVVLYITWLLILFVLPGAVGLFETHGVVRFVSWIAGFVCVAVPLGRRNARERARERNVAYVEGLDASFDDQDFFETPEAAALSGWSASAGAHVLRTTFVRDDVAEVLVDTVPSHPMTVRCQRSDKGWIWTSDMSA